MIRIIMIFKIVLSTWININSFTIKKERFEIPFRFLSILVFYHHFIYIFILIGLSILISDFIKQPILYAFYILLVIDIIIAYYISFRLIKKREKGI
jgi:hypothetical protein